MSGIIESTSPEETFAVGEQLGSVIAAGDVILLRGGLGAGKTLFTKGVMNALEFDIDEVTSPSFSLVNLYRTERLNVYHIDLWRLDERSDPAFAIGLDDILDDPAAAVIIEWAERLRGGEFTANNVIEIDIEGDGDDARHISVKGPKGLQQAF